MGLNEEMKDFFANDEIEVVLDYPLVFKSKLQLSDSGYEYLNAAKNLDKYASSLFAGLATASVGYAAFIASLSWFGGILVAAGILATPIGWIALAGGAGATLMFGGKHLVEKIDKKISIKIPKHTNTPINLLATTLLNYILPLAIKVSLIDNEFKKEEGESIVQYFKFEWGYNNDYLNLMMSQMVAIESTFELDDLKKKLEAIVKNTKGLEYDTMKSEIITLLKMVCEVNNKEAQKYSAMIDIITNL